MLNFQKLLFLALPFPPSSPSSFSESFMSPNHCICIHVYAFYEYSNNPDLTQTFHIAALQSICCTVLHSTMKITLFLFVSQVTANALPVRRTRECWWICQHKMDRQFLRVLIPLVVSTHFCTYVCQEQLQYTHIHTLFLI